MLQPSFRATVPMDQDDRQLQDNVGCPCECRLKSQTSFLPLPLLSSVVLVMALHRGDVGLCFGVPGTNKPREVVSGNCSAAGRRMAFAACFARTSIQRVTGEA